MTISRLAAVALLILPGAAAGAAMAQSASDRCLALADDDARIACLVAALDAAEAADTRESSGGRFRIPFLGDGRDDEASAPAPDAQTPAPTGLGADQVTARATRETGVREEREWVRAAIVRVHERVPGQLVFELDNGEVWRQLSGDGQRLHLYPDEPIPVEMSSSWAGGYRMILPDERKVVRVERLR